MATQTFKQRRHNKAAFFFPLNFYVYADVDNRERARARARDEKQRSKSSSEEQHEHFVAPVRQREMLADSKVKMSSSEDEHKQQHFCFTYTKCPP